jgi:hypothetical protein
MASLASPLFTETFVHYRHCSIIARDLSRVVAIVLNRNRYDLVVECLLKLREQSHPPSDVVLVDDASTDGSIQSARKLWPGIHIIALPEPSGVIAARNAGLDFVLNRLSFDYVCFLDNDAFLEPTALAEMVAAAERDPSVGMVTPKAYQSLHGNRLACAGGMTANFYLGLFCDVGHDEIDDGQYDQPADVPACPGFAFLVRKEAIERVGLFDVELRRYGWEDVDYSLRVAAAGYRLRYAPKARVEHRGGYAGRGVVASYEFWKFRNLFVLMLRYANPLQWLCFLITLPPRCVYVMVRLLWARAGRRMVSSQRKRIAAPHEAP